MSNESIRTYRYPLYDKNGVPTGGERYVKYVARTNMKYNKEVSPELKDTITRRYNDGVSKTRLIEDYKLSYTRLNKIILNK